MAYVPARGSVGAMTSSAPSLPDRLATPVRAFMRPRRHHRAVSPISERTPHGVVAPMDLIDLVTRP